MKRAITAAGMLLCSLSQAYATTHYENSYRDVIRSHGHKRSQAVYDSALDACYAQTGLSRDVPDSQAFKDCMKGFGFRWLSTSWCKIRSAGRRTTASSTPTPG
jgi:hypothetical protein